LPWLLWGEGDMYTNTEKEVASLKAKNTQLTEKVAMLEKIVALYERNENAKQSPA
jgi:predicted S18 family serine protease